MDLRKKIEAAIVGATERGQVNHAWAVDAILAIPELKEALEVRDAIVRNKVEGQRQGALLRQMVALDEALGLYDDDEKVPRN